MTLTKHIHILILLPFLLLATLSAKEPKPKASKLVKQIYKHLVNNKGKRVKYKNLKKMEYIMLYYSAHWCPPCQKFTPKLVDFYKKHKDKYNFEIIFISSDGSTGKMKQYMKKAKMPWFAIDYKKIKKSGVRKYEGRGIPCLVLFDQKGKQISHSYKGKKYLGPTKVMRDLEKLLSEKKEDV